MKYQTTLACFLFASALPAIGLAATRSATDAEYRGIRESLKSQGVGGGSVKLWEVHVGKDPNKPSGKVQLVCGFANGTRFYGTLGKGNDGKPHVMILGTDSIADAMCAEKLGI